MAIIGVWLLGTIVVAILGNGRKIGVIGALFASLLLSPLIGLIITLSSKRIEDMEREIQTTLEAKRQTAALEAMKAGSLADQLGRLVEMRNAGTITEEDYNAAKNKLLA